MCEYDRKKCGITKVKKSQNLENIATRVLVLFTSIRVDVLENISWFAGGSNKLDKIFL